MATVRQDELNVVEQCVIDLYNVGVVKFGSFTLKSGMLSPVYFDLRIIISFPKLMETVAEVMWAKRPGNQYKLGVPMLIRRKERKGYGTKKMVEGNFEAGQKCLMIEDVIVSGSSVYETVEVQSVGQFK
ncbi:Uridine 5'-monophosphate synthase-like 2 [Homarus americanus]|uniref:Uridine 5'-monophosphate synthase-like 2 n=1 Tax=Homarus americanus TaxID=6706 RepID=A0A8J5T1X2_HOMAM|nr:Uridine 5'-monophosphate synthase-like 2 [Homarus americanus]